VEVGPPLRQVTIVNARDEPSEDYVLHDEKIAINSLRDLYDALAELLQQQEARLNQRLDKSMSMPMAPLSHKQPADRKSPMPHGVHHPSSHSKGSSGASGFSQGTIHETKEVAKQPESRFQGLMLPAGLEGHWDKMITNAEKHIEAFLVTDRSLEKSWGFRSYDVAIIILILANLLFLGVQVEEEATGQHAKDVFAAVSWTLT
jgi:hypothetical protein